MKLKSYISSKAKKIEQLMGLPIMLFSSCFIAGIIFYDHILVVLILFLFILKKNFLIIPALVFLVIGSIYSNNYLAEFDNEIGNEMTEMIATVVEPTEIKGDRSEVIVNIKDHLGNTLIRSLNSDKFIVGDELKVEGKVQKIDEDDDFGKYLITRKVNSKMDNPEITLLSTNESLLSKLNHIREDLIVKIEANLKNPESALFAGILLGKKESFDDDLKENLMRSGTSHIISASGSNVLIIYILLNSMGGLISRKYLNLLSIVGIILYLLLIGTYILPALRATVMLLIFIIGKMLGRKHNVLIALNLSIIMILIIFPLYYKNISFQLSLFASLGLFALGPIAFKFLKTHLKFLPDSVNEILGTSLAAIVATMPIILMRFGSVAFLAILSNLLIVPLISIVMVIGMIALFIEYLKVEVIASILFFIIQSLTSFMANAITFFGKLNFGYSENKTLNLGLFIFLIILFLLYDLRKYEKSH